MNRAADYAIQGFLYQFDKTLFEILKADDDWEITVEGVIEDIDVSSPHATTAIQCKYHEAKTKFQPSDIYKPLLQMMSHYHQNQGLDVKYVLFAHFPDKDDGSSLGVDKKALEKALKTTEKGLNKYVTELSGKVDLDAFLNRFSGEFGPRSEELRRQVCALLEAAGFSLADVEVLAYPNALQTIADLSTVHDAARRKITRRELVGSLQSKKSTAVSRWTLALKTKKQLLDARRKQLSGGLNVNSRQRLIVMFPDSIGDFDELGVSFIDDYVQKYHCKPAHLATPVFSINRGASGLRGLQQRLYESKQLVATDGRVGSRLYDERFHRTPMKRKKSGGGDELEFCLRLIGWNRESWPILNRLKAKDVYVIGSGDVSPLNIADNNVELIQASSLREVRYVMGVSNAYE